MLDYFARHGLKLDVETTTKLPSTVSQIPKRFKNTNVAMMTTFLCVSFLMLGLCSIIIVLTFNMRIQDKLHAKKYDKCSRICQCSQKICFFINGIEEFETDTTKTYSRGGEINLHDQVANVKHLEVKLPATKTKTKTTKTSKTISETLHNLLNLGRNSFSGLFSSGQYLTVERDPEKGNDKPVMQNVVQAEIHSQMNKFSQSDETIPKSGSNEWEKSNASTTSQSQRRKKEYHQYNTVGNSAPYGGSKHPNIEPIEVGPNSEAPTVHTENNDVKCEDISRTINEQCAQTTHDVPLDHTLPSEHSSLLSSPGNVTDASGCGLSLPSDVFGYSSRVESRLDSAQYQNADVNENESESQERLVQPMQAVGGNHYDGMDAIREQVAGK